MKKLLLVATCVLLFASALRAQTHTFALSNDNFLLDGKPFQIISGEMHYPRVPREAWRARMKMARAMGLNTIGTYVFWNLHEPQRGVFDFTGNNDVAEFVKIAKEEGLWVILRPSPYVCAEWEFGGYPYWLQTIPGLQVRSKEPQYLKEYQAYIKEIGKQLAPLQISHGGNILMVQVENEYGSYAADKEYLDINRKMFIDAGFDGLLYTCDGPSQMPKGYLPGLLPGINGEDDVKKVKTIVNANHDGHGPYYISEWYPAWFDSWGSKHHTVPAEEYAPKLDSVLAAGLSINMYMFHGGTTRGFMNGANYSSREPYSPQTSSYDYDAPLDEAGNPTPKFMKFREVIQRHLPAGQTLPPVPAAKRTMALPDIDMTEKIYFLGNAKTSRNSNFSTFEDMKQAYGFMLYFYEIKGGTNRVLKLNGLSDYAIIYANKEKLGTLDRRLNQDSLQVDIPSLPDGSALLTIWVENMGRINYGKFLLQNKKGITQGVTLDGKPIKPMVMNGLAFDDITKIKPSPGNDVIDNFPVLRKQTFNLTDVADTYLNMRNWGKGVVWVNGHNLGRYWSIGPQQTLYLPAEWLKMGKNEIWVLEELKTDETMINSSYHPILDQVRK